MHQEMEIELDKEPDSDGAKSESWMDRMVKRLEIVCTGSEAPNDLNGEESTVKRLKKKRLKEMRYKIS
jgi:hypothetical protein